MPWAINVDLDPDSNDSAMVEAVFTDDAEFADTPFTVSRHIQLSEDDLPNFQADAGKLLGIERFRRQQGVELAKKLTEVMNSEDREIKSKTPEPPMLSTKTKAMVG